jgi:hypothetical protein
MRRIIDIDDKVYELLNKTGITIDWNTAFHGKEKDREMTFAIFDLVEALKNGTPYEKRPKGEWILVSERLPDKNGNYLCTVDYGEDGVEVTQRFYLDTLSGFEKRYNKNDKVIAWQPLPEPYKEGGAK